METLLILGLVGVLAYYAFTRANAPVSYGSNVPTGLGYLASTDIANYASSAGFTGDDVNTAVAIALAESSGNADAYNPETEAGAQPGMGSYGLWQIFLTDHPEAQGQNLYDPQTNANFAFSIYAARGDFSAWSSYTSGAYQKFLGS